MKITKLGTGGTTGSPPIWVNLEMDFTELTLRVDAISGSGHRVRVTRGQKEWFVPVGGTIKVKGPGPTKCWLVINPPGADNTYSTAKGGCAFNFRWYAWQTSAQPKTARGHRRVHPRRLAGLADRVPRVPVRPRDAGGADQARAASTSPPR